MVSLIPPSPGETLNNDQLTTAFLCSGQGGMRRSKRTNTLVIISNHVESVYDDRWMDDVLHYTGMGQVGDQSLEFNQNKTLSKSSTNGVAIHLFEVFTKRTYTYIGEVYLSAEPYQETQLDSQGKERSVWVFPLRLKTGGLPAIQNTALKELDQIKQKKARTLSNTEIHALAKKQGQNQVGKRSTIITQHIRSPWVAEHARRRANGKCELCGEAAPFERKDGSPYLETHHIDWLAHNGADTVTNTVALCPNCHRKMHILNDEEDRKKLKERLSRLELAK